MVTTNWWPWATEDLAQAIKGLPHLTSQQRRSALGQVRYYSRTYCFRAKKDILRFIANQLGLKLESRTQWVYDEYMEDTVPGDTEYRFVLIHYGLYTVSISEGSFGETYTVAAPWGSTDEEVLRYLSRDVPIKGEARIYGPYPIRPGMIAEGVGDY